MQKMMLTLTLIFFLTNFALATYHHTTSKKPPKCPANETFVQCANPCEPSCFDPKPEVCIKRCDPAKCQCKKGYVRDKYLDCCVKQKYCSCMGPNEEYKECATCEGTCANPNPPCPKLKICKPPKCQCRKGYVRKNGKCIDKDKCPNPCVSKSCKYTEKCVVDCYHKAKCVPKNPCTGYRCPSKTKCALQSVDYCKCKPCQPIPKCQPIKYDTEFAELMMEQLDLE